MDRRHSEVRSTRERFFDGCHRYGWLITIAVLLAQTMFWSGAVNATVGELKERMTRLEIMVNQLMMK